MKINSLEELICSPSFLYESWLALKKKGNTPGIDGVDLKDFADGAEEKIRVLARKIERDNYYPYPYRRIGIKKKDGSTRFLCIPTVRDRIVQHAVNRILQAHWDSYFLDTSFAYRRGLGVDDAVNKVISLIEDGKTWFIRGDIRGCFDEFDMEILSFLVNDWIKTRKIARITEGAFRAPILEHGRVIRRTKGVPQGSPLSPILSNLYLHTLDYGLARLGIDIVRYADDWIILCKSEKEMRHVYRVVFDFTEDIRVELNLEKTDIGNLEDQEIRFLGFTIDAWSAIDDHKPLKRAYFSPVKEGI